MSGAGENNDEVASMGAGELRDILFGPDGTLHYAIFETEETATMAVPWNDLNLQAISGVETADPEYGFTARDGALEGRTIQLADDVLGDESGFMDTAETALEAEDNRLLRASALLDGPFTDEGITVAGGQSLGNVRDLLLDVNAGRVEYVVTDGESEFLTDQRPISIPWQRLSYSAEDNHFTGDVEQEMLGNSPEFDLDSAFEQNAIHMDDARRTQLDEYWGVGPATGADDDKANENDDENENDQ